MKYWLKYSTKKQVQWLFFMLLSISSFGIQTTSKYPNDQPIIEFLLTNLFTLWSKNTEKTHLIPNLKQFQIHVFVSLKDPNRSHTCNLKRKKKIYFFHIRNNKRFVVVLGILTDGTNINRILCALSKHFICFIFIIIKSIVRLEINYDKSKQLLDVKISWKIGFETDPNILMSLNCKI